ncbi:hypothetical protein C0993_006213, partial [Termitomyces sp. T159_Od127]
PKILNLGLLKLALLWLEIELMLVEVFQDDACDLAVLFKYFGVDEDVTKVYAHYAFSDEVSKDVIHHFLKSGKAI